MNYMKVFSIFLFFIVLIANADDKSLFYRLKPYLNNDKTIDKTSIGLIDKLDGKWEFIEEGIKKDPKIEERFVYLPIIKPYSYETDKIYCSILKDFISKAKSTNSKREILVLAIPNLAGTTYSIQFLNKILPELEYPKNGTNNNLNFVIEKLRKHNQFLLDLKNMLQNETFKNWKTFHYTPKSSNSQHTKETDPDTGDFLELDKETNQSTEQFDSTEACNILKLINISKEEYHLDLEKIFLAIKKRGSRIDEFFQNKDEILHFPQLKLVVFDAKKNIRFLFSFRTIGKSMFLECYIVTFYYDENNKLSYLVTSNFKPFNSDIAKYLRKILSEIISTEPENEKVRVTPLLN